MVWSWGNDTFEFFCTNVYNIFEFQRTSLKIIKDERFATEHFVQFSCGAQDRFRAGFFGQFNVIPNCTLPSSLRKLPSHLKKRFLTWMNELI